MMDLITETSRLHIRNWSRGDAMALIKLCQQPSVSDYAISGFEINSGNAIDWLEGERNSYYKYGWGRFAVTSKDFKQLLAIVGLFKMPKEYDNILALNFKIPENYWLQEFASEAAKSIIEYGFSYLQEKEIYGFTHVENKLAIQLFEKVGMKKKNLIDFFGISAEQWSMKS